MKNFSSMAPPPPPFHSCSTVADEIEDTNNLEVNNTTALRPQVVEKKSETKAKYKLESKPSMDINESAEQFIKKFRKQLLIQRLESIENYEQMLARGL